MQARTLFIALISCALAASCPEAKKEGPREAEKHGHAQSDEHGHRHADEHGHEHGDGHGHEHGGHHEGEHGHEHGEADAHEGHDHEDGEGEGEHGLVSLTREAMELAGIRVGKVERRSLAGGAAIPAEIQFEPSSTAQVRPLVTGRITKVLVSLGSSVKRGEVLGTIASGDVSTARARMDQARARLQAARANLERQRKLVTEGIGSQRSLIDAEAQVGELSAEVEGLRRQLSVFGTGKAGELSLVSPIEGVVVEVAGTIGESVSPEQPIFIVTDPSKVWVRGNVPELELSRIQLGIKVWVRLHAFPDLTMPGSIVYVAPALDEPSRSLPIRVALERPDSRLRSGLFGSIELAGGFSGEVPLAVPADALATIGGQQMLFVPVASAKAGGEVRSFKPIPVVVGKRAGGMVELVRGVEEGNEVILAGSFTLKSALLASELSEGHVH